MNLDKQKKFLISFAFYGILAAGVFLACKYLMPPLMPFVIGFLVALLLRRPALWLKSKLPPKLPAKVPAVLLTIAVYILAISVVFLVGLQVWSAMGSALPKLPDLVMNQLLPFITNTIEVLRELLIQLDIAAPAQIDSWLSELSTSVISLITSFSTSAVKWVSGFAAGMPAIILRVVLTVISTFYFSVDFERITGFLLKCLPEKVRVGLAALKEKALHSLKIFTRSYILVFLMTFCELSLGFAILQLPYPALLGILVAIVDILPVLGTGLVLLPWALICLVIGEYFLGLGLLVLYIVITVIRNIVEPKLVGEQIGLHPLLTLISMFVGLQLFGLIGLFLFPVTLSILVQFRDDAPHRAEKKAAAAGASDDAVHGPPPENSPE